MCFHINSIFHKKSLFCILCLSNMSKLFRKAIIFVSFITWAFYCFISDSILNQDLSQPAEITPSLLVSMATVVIIQRRHIKENKGIEPAMPSYSGRLVLLLPRGDLRKEHIFQREKQHRLHLCEQMNE